MKLAFLNHYTSVEHEAKTRLKEFEEKRNANNEELFEEMAFCVFAANSSADMGLLAVNLLKPILQNGTLDDYKLRVHKKVRFYNKRSEYLFQNREQIRTKDIDLNKIIYDSELSTHEKRVFIKNNFKGFGLKEASHFLRNTGLKGLCIIDKHVLIVMRDLGVLEENDFPHKEQDYYLIEQKIIKFAEENNLDIDVLDLAAWSYRTGKIIK